MNNVSYEVTKLDVDLSLQGAFLRVNVRKIGDTATHSFKTCISNLSKLQSGNTFTKSDISILEHSDLSECIIVSDSPINLKGYVGFPVKYPKFNTSGWTTGYIYTIDFNVDIVRSVNEFFAAIRGSRHRYGCYYVSVYSDDGIKNKVEISGRLAGSIDIRARNNAKSTALFNVIATLNREGIEPERIEFSVQSGRIMVISIIL